MMKCFSSTNFFAGKTILAGFVFCLLFQASCKGKPGETISNPDIIRVYPDWVYDLSGSELSGGGNPFRLFDEPADPVTNPAARPLTGPLPSRNPSIFFKKGKGLRIVVDLQVTYAMKYVYVYDPGIAGDSVWIEYGEPGKWTTGARLKTGSVPGWQKVQLASNMRFISFRFNSPASSLNEVVLFGRTKIKIPTPPVYAYSDKIVRPVTLGNFVGVNSFDAAEIKFLEPFAQTRLYQNLDWYDNDPEIPFPKNKVTLNFFQKPHDYQYRYYIDSLRVRYGAKLWFTIQGPPRSLTGKPFNTRPVDVPGLDPEDPASYKRRAKVFFTLAGAYGSKKIDTALLDIADVEKFSGSNLMTRLENGNENDASWDSLYWTPAEYFAMSSADYDGHEGTIGPRLGLAAADPSMKLMTSGMIELDTARVRTLAFLSRTMRKDHRFIWEGGVQYHHYSNDGAQHTPPTTPFTPEADNMRYKLTRARLATQRIAPGVPVILGENGYDRMQTSWQHVPLIDGLDAEESQGVMVIRSIMAAFMSGVDGYNFFMLRNATGDDNATGTFATSGVINGAGTKTYKVWYYIRNVVQALKDYEPDAIVSETGNVWVYRLRNRLKPAEICYYLVAPEASVDKPIPFELKSATFKAQKMAVLDFMSADKPVWRAVSAGSGKVNLTIGPVPVFLR
jgi:hypothetical protein